MEYRAIRKLPEEIIGKIAAGEVVESPAAAIKELVENSIDAHARNVTVEIREGGIAYLRVTDNGTGIRREDVRMAFERHATSKISKADDLFQLSSLGFRGEALASIAAVSKVTLTTRTPGDERGTRVICTGGVIESINDAASPEGTTIVARDLFYNTPVRLKFLKKPSTEAGRVCEMMLRMIISHPDVSFRVISNEKQVYMSPGNGDLRAAAFCLYGREVANGLTWVKGIGGIGVHGLVGVGPLARANRTHQTFIINGRYVKSALLSQALEDACKERVTVGHYPICLLHVDMTGAMVDVNVHPNKLEVRFSDENLVYTSVKGAIEDGFVQDVLEAAPAMTLAPEKAETKTEVTVQVAQPVQTPQPPSVQPKPQTAPEKDVPVSSFGRFVSGYFAGAPAHRVMHESAAPLTNLPPINFAPYMDDLANISQETKKADEVPAQVQPCQSIQHTEKTDDRSENEQLALETPVAEARPASAAMPKQEQATEKGSEKDAFPFKILSVLFDTYILLEGRDRLLLVDQHAAHERVLYERMMRSVDTDGASQGLLVSQVVRVSAQERERLDTYAEEIKAAGFEIEPFDEDSVRILSVPMVLGMPQARQAFMDMVDQLGQLRVLGTAAKRREAIVQMACKHAVKGGDKLSTEEIVRLLKDVLASDAPPTCPHGRPLVVSISRSEIEKRFRRINN